jgi:hypothetical protein
MLLRMLLMARGISLRREMGLTIGVLAFGGISAGWDGAASGVFRRIVRAQAVRSAGPAGGAGRRPLAIDPDL